MSVTPSAAAALPDWLLSLGALMGTIGAAAFAYKGKPAEKALPASDATTQVVAATFTERAQMERLITAMQALDATLRAATECSHELVVLLKADAHRREVQAEVEMALKHRGIIGS